MKLHSKKFQKSFDVAVLVLCSVRQNFLPDSAFVSMDSGESSSTGNKRASMSLAMTWPEKSQKPENTHLNILLNFK